jgi:2-polyprenyl-3-methyl-5-hydroxy-6-metoxy-1,4-benzoquinol methylase
MHTNSRLLFLKYARQYFRPGMRVLEIGPDTVPSTYQRAVGEGSIVWHTLDLRDDPSLTYHALSEYEFPVESASYDIVLSAQVIEHVRQIWVWIQELARVCKPGGLVVTINPVSWPYHEAPIDCWRAFPEGMKALYHYASLEVKLSRWESLEAPSHRHRIPGRSAEFQNPRMRLTYRLLGMVGFPVECAYDTITIGEKT